MSLLVKNVILNNEKKDIYIKEKRIEKIGKSLNYKVKEKIDGKGRKAILPGLVNCHTHSSMIIFRGYGDDLPLKEWLEEKIWPLEAKLTKEDIYWGTKLACLEMIKTGTTCFNDMYWHLGHPEITIKAIQEMGLRAVIGFTILDAMAEGTKETITELYGKFKNKHSDLITFSIAPHSIYTVSKENLIWAKDFARKNNLLLHIHLSETEKEVEDCQKKYGLRPVEFLEEIGFLGENTVLAHSVFLSEKEIEILGKRKCSVVNNPVSNLKLGTGAIFPYKSFKEAGVDICLGTDSAVSNNNLDLFEEMKFAALLQKFREKNPAQVKAKEIVEVATRNGAEALKIDAGEIKEGKLADFILIDLNQLCLCPGLNFYSDLVYSASGNCVSDMICNGNLIMRERKVKGEEEIMEKAFSLSRKLTGI